MNAAGGLAETERLGDREESIQLLERDTHNLNE
jgi:hypothetical protein